MTFKGTDCNSSTRNNRSPARNVTSAIRTRHPDAEAWLESDRKAMRVMLGRGQIEQTIAMILSFACDFRPSECDMLTALQVVAPVAAGAAVPRLAALMLHPRLGLDEETTCP